MTFSLERLAYLVHHGLELGEVNPQLQLLGLLVRKPEQVAIRVDLVEVEDTVLDPRRQLAVALRLDGFRQVFPAVGPLGLAPQNLQVQFEDMAAAASKSDAA